MMVILFSLPVDFFDGGHVEDAVGVDVVGDFDLGHTAGHGGDAIVEVRNLPRSVVVARHGCARPRRPG